MGSSLLLQECPSCLAYLPLTVSEMGGKKPYNCCLVGCCFYTARSILLQFPHSFFSRCFDCTHEVHSFCIIDTGIAWKESRFILSDRLDFQMVNNLSVTFHAFARCMLTSLSVDKILLPKYNDTKMSESL